MIHLHRVRHADFFNFPAGEPHVRVRELDPGARHITIEYRWDPNSNLSEDIIRILLAADAIRNKGGVVHNVILDYLPFGRQDRVAVDGDAFSVRVFADIINTIGAEHITLCDPHSAISPRLFRNVRVITQAELLAPALDQIPPPYYLVAPDEGARTKTRDLQWCAPNAAGVLEATKARDPESGAIYVGDLGDRFPDAGFAHYVIVDDICDGGGTFVLLAEKLRERTPECTVSLVVSHGLFTKGFDVFEGKIDSIWVRGDKIR